MADNGTLELWKRLKNMVEASIDSRTRSCCRTKKMVVSTAYNEQTKSVGVIEPFGKEIQIPVFDVIDTSKLSVGVSVWVFIPFGSMSNAIVMMLGDGSGSGTTDIPLATATTAGIVQIGNGLNVNNGIVSVDPTWSQIAKYIYPVGCIVELTVPSNPAELWGFGTWQSYMPGRVLVGAGTADSRTVFVAGATGGEETHTLTTSEMPSHYHKEVLPLDPDTARPIGMADYNASYTDAEQVTSGGNKFWNTTISYSSVSASNPAYRIKTLDEGGSKSHNIMQPYGVVYRWMRVA